MSTVRLYVQSIVRNPETRNVFFFLLLNISFTGVEFFYGWWTNSLGLTADAVHMLFDSTALIASLIASVITKRPATVQYSYGFVCF
jgi:zinc transporter 5/7